jgi:ketosteroid isomerase-like protein
MNDLPSFRKFLKLRDRASAAYVSGDATPLAALSATSGEASFFGPMGGEVVGAKKVLARYIKDAAHFDRGSENVIKVLQMGASDGLAFVVARQKTKAKLAGNPRKVPMELRVTEIFRKSGSTWKLIHRHADMLAKESPPKR